MKKSQQPIPCYRALLVFSVVMSLFLLQPVLQLVNAVQGVAVELSEFDNEGDSEKKNEQEKEISEEEKIITPIQFQYLSISIKKGQKMRSYSDSFFGKIVLEVNAPPPDFSV